jgi:NAD(P)-dependent dehydrogenase (short-subunit alcohol dehydrogenase family)
MGTSLQVVLHGRSQQRIDAAVQDILATCPGADLAWVKADFASLADVRRMGDELHQMCDRIDVLINNAGVFQHTFQKTPDGMPPCPRVCLSAKISGCAFVFAWSLQLTHLPGSPLRRK